jgi:hypothetical protein
VQRHGFEPKGKGEETIQLFEIAMMHNSVQTGLVSERTQLFDALIVGKLAPPSRNRKG